MSCTVLRSDFEKRLKEIPGLIDVNSDLLIASPEVIVDIDRDHASSLGVTADQIGNALYERLWHAPGIRHLCARPTITG